MTHEREVRQTIREYGRDEFLYLDSIDKIVRTVEEKRRGK